MIQIINTPSIRYNFILQYPDNITKEKYRLATFFHGSRDGKYVSFVEESYNELMNGRLQFSKDINSSTIFIVPIISSIHAHLSNGLEVDPQRLTRGCMHVDCEKEFMDDYNPHLEIEKMIEYVKDMFSSRCRIHEKISLIGVSAGGAFATCFASIFPEMIGSVVSFLNYQTLIPLEMYKNVPLLFPFGLSGMEDIPSAHIDKEKAIDTSQFQK